MNKSKRERLRTCISKIDDIISEVESICSEEECSMENIPDGLQNSTRYYDMEDAISNMNDSIGKLEEAQELIDEIL